ncbi:MAG TPA: ABC transporter permease [Methanocorpusculum sp.]|nr:ABC transporter permease [Methanocorpusculum sp.]HJK80973.1 ABC transporter permease [Methanocorpusculum sp.]
MNRRYLLPLLCIAAFAAMAAVPDLLAPFTPTQRFIAYQGPDAVHLLGTDDMGRDILSLVIYAARLSLVIGVASGALAIVIGTAVGLAAGWRHGLLDDVLMGTTDIVLIIPKIPLVIILAAYLSPGPWLLILVLGLLSWESVARVVRSKVLQIRSSGYILAARCFGFSDTRIVLREVLPVVFPVIVPKFVLVTASAMISEASLSFLGLSDPAMISWGVMIADAFNHGGFIREMWYWWMPPAVCIIFGVLAITSLAFIREQGVREVIQV